MLANNMPLIRRLVPLALAIVVAVASIELIRRRKLREEYAMLWIVASIGMLVFAIFPGILFKLQEVLKVSYLTIVLLAGFLFLAMILLHFAVVISRQSEEIRQLAQRHAILRQSVEKLQRNRSSAGADDEDAGPAPEDETE